MGRTMVVGTLGAATVGTNDTSQRAKQRAQDLLKRVQVPVDQPASCRDSASSFHGHAPCAGGKAALPAAPFHDSTLHTKQHTEGCSPIPVELQLEPCVSELQARIEQLEQENSRLNAALLQQQEQADEAARALRWQVDELQQQLAAEKQCTAQLRQPLMLRPSLDQLLQQNRTLAVAHHTLRLEAEQATRAFRDQLEQLQQQLAAQQQQLAATTEKHQRLETQQSRWKHAIHNHLRMRHQAEERAEQAELEAEAGRHQLAALQAYCVEQQVQRRASELRRHLLGAAPPPQPSAHRGALARRLLGEGEAAVLGAESLSSSGRAAVHRVRDPRCSQKGAGARLPGRPSPSGWLVVKQWPVQEFGTGLARDQLAEVCVMLAVAGSELGGNSVVLQDWAALRGEDGVVRLVAVMEFHRGDDVWEQLQRRVVARAQAVQRAMAVGKLGKAQRAEAVRGLRDMVDALVGMLRCLVAVHGAGMVHGDVKGENFVLQHAAGQGQGQEQLGERSLRDLVLIDLESLQPVLRHTGRTTRVGAYTDEYAAPEQLQGDGAFTCAASDVFAVGRLVAQLRVYLAVLAVNRQGRRLLEGLLELEECCCDPCHKARPTAQAALDFLEGL